MNLAYETRALRSLCEREHLAEREYGIAVATQLKHRLDDLEAATNALDLVVAKPEPQAGSTTLRIRLGRKAFIEFIANHQDVPVGKNRRVDWSRVSRIKITKIEVKDA